MSEDDRLDALQRDLLALRDRLQAQTRERHQRLNPFFEDLVDWRATGRAWTGDDRDVTVYGSATLIGDVEIGAATWVGPFCMLDGSGGLTIGHHCSIATGAQLLSHDTVQWALTGGERGPERTATSVGDCCFIGSHAVITRGVSIGDHCVIAAGAVVTGDVPARSIVAGVPATRIGHVRLTPDGAVLEYDGAAG